MIAAIWGGKSIVKDEKSPLMILGYDIKLYQHGCFFFSKLS